MKIAIIGTTSAMMINFRQDLIKELIQKQHEVLAFALDYDEKSKEKISALGAIPVDYIFSKTGLNPLSDFKNTLKFSRLLKKHQPDMVFSYVTKPVIFGTLAAKLAGIKNRYGMLEGLGYSFTETPENPSPKKKLIKRIQILLYKISVPLLKRLIVLNPDDKIELTQAYKIKVADCQVLGGIGLNLADFPFSPPFIQKISFIFIARLLKEKGIYEYTDAARRIKKSHPEVEFIVLGGIDTQNPGGLQHYELENLIQDNIINYLGHVTDVKKWLQQSSVFVLPSYREGVPRSTQEAMATGRAIITTDVPGCRETVIDGLNGFLVKPWSVEDLVKAMEQFIQNPELIESMGNESYKLAKERFDAQAVNKKLLNLLDVE